MDILEAIPEKDRQRFENTIEKLLRHSKEDEVIFVGGLSKRYHFKNQGINYDDDEFDDLDVIITERETIRPTINEDFLIYHYHIYDQETSADGDRFYIVPLDPESKLKIDCFDYKKHQQSEPITVSFKDKDIKISTQEDQLAVEVYEALRIREGHTQPRKKLNDIDLLVDIVEMEKSEEYWQEKPYSTELTLKEAIEQIKKIAEEKPDLVVTHKFRREPYECKYCNPPTDFPLMPMEKAYEILGYVE